ncbi:hypothetical protein D9Q98_009601 [Chlorella vulgaris]|uniref:Uncharacterized protein n=1 Tax=Chlorella vulgaris TaxID=3077 RepID=A0A9D4TFF2_CHLVU|nr:hypothetical protein D9Q98_009601 [Chlorella vulgaris]
MGRSQGRGPLGVIAALLGVCLLAASPLLLYRSVASVTRSQQQVLQVLQQSLADVKAERDAATSQMDAIKTQLLELQDSMDQKVTQLSGLSSVAEDIKFDLDKHNAQFSPADRISEQPASAIVRIDSKGQYVASPSIIKLPSGRLLVALERAVTWGQTKETTMKLIYSSDDGGSSWQRAAVVGPMNWPQIFSCASGTYLMGTERHFSANNNLVISKMLDDKGTSWSVPTKLTDGISVVSANQGVDVSLGRVTKAFEVIPSLAAPLVKTNLTQAVKVVIEGGVDGPTWEHQPVLELHVLDTTGFVLYTLVKVPYRDKALFFRIDKIDAGRKIVSARLERFNLFWQKEGLTLGADSTLQVASGAQIYGGVDWVASAMSADETADLRDPSAWVLSDGVGNPASMYSNEMRALFDAAFRGDSSVRQSIVGFDVPGLDTSSAWEAGFGSLYWMEGVVTRVHDKHGGNNKLLSIMRVNNDMLCDLAALVEYDDSSLLPPANASAPADGKDGKGGGNGKLGVRFLRYAFIPGLGVGHPAIVYDEVSDLYWMVTNINRDSNRNWKQPDKPDGINPSLHITAFSKCEVDRSTLALYYSSNLVSWVLAGMVDYHINLGRHFAYPHMLVDGRDLLIVSRAAFAPWAHDSDAVLNGYYNNHNSNTIAFHRVKNFRHYANIDWVRYQGPYSKFPRRTAMKDEVENEEAAKAFAANVKAAQKAADEAAAADTAARDAAAGGKAAPGEGGDGGKPAAEAAAAGGKEAAVERAAGDQQAQPQAAAGATGDQLAGLAEQQQQAEQQVAGKTQQAESKGRRKLLGQTA